MNLVSERQGTDLRLTCGSIRIMRCWMRRGSIFTGRFMQMRLH